MGHVMQGQCICNLGNANKAAMLKAEGHNTVRSMHQYCVLQCIGLCIRLCSGAVHGNVLGLYACALLTCSIG
jgi:hypothetical protein